MSQDELIAEIERREAARHAAMLAKDKVVLEDLLDDQLVYVHSSGVADTKASYLEGLQTGVWDYHRVDVSGQQYAIHGDTVLMFCRLAIEVTVRGIFKSFETNALLVWIHDSIGWRLAAVQSSSIPVMS